MVSRVRRTIAFVVVLVLAVTIALADRLVWRPHEDVLTYRSDAIVVLGGVNDPVRVQLGRALALRENVPLAISVDDPATSEFCHPNYKYPRQPLCFRATPFSTRGEARTIAAFARVRGWHSVTVVVTVDQVARARVRLTRCHVPGLVIAAAHTTALDRIKKTPYQLAAFVKAEVLQRSC